MSMSRLFPLALFAAACSSSERIVDPPGPPDPPGDTTAADTTVQLLPIRGAGTLAVSDGTCALAPGGAAWCWGPNWTGQVGNGRILESADPVAVTGGHSFRSLSTSIVDIGDAPSPSVTSLLCGLDTGGTIRCWGNAYFAASSSTPEAIAPGQSFKAMVTGFRWLCALDTAGRPYCWGSGDYSPTDQTATAPAPVGGNHVFESLDGGNQRACALKSDGSAWCWGAAWLGDSTTNGSTTPVRVSGGLAFTSISSGYAHVCGLRADGQAFCWGQNYGGALGDGTTTDRLSPVAVMGGYAFRSISAGDWKTCGITLGDDLVCWGDGFAVRPAPVGAAAAFASVDAGYEGSPVCGTDKSGRGWCLDATRFVAVPGNVAFASINSGREVFCGLTSGGAAYCWGRNEHGTLGDGSPINVVAPAAVTGGQTFAAIHSARSSTCGLTHGEVWCWGWGYGPPRTTDRTFYSGRSSPLRINAPALVALATGSDNHCGLDATGQLFCWHDRDGASPVAPGYQFAEVSSSGSWACGISRVGRTLCWGWGSMGQLGRDVEQSNDPVEVATALRLVTVTTGTAHACGLTSAGDAWCWGWNASGQLGAATGRDRNPAAVQVQGGHAFTALTAGWAQTCALKSSGEAWCWGMNDRGQLGNGTTTGGHAPVPVSGGHSFTAITASMEHACGTRADGSVWCWGVNNYGSLGDGTRNSSLVPVRVSAFTAMAH